MKLSHDINNSNGPTPLTHLSISQLATLTGRDRRTIRSKLKNLEPVKEEKNLVLFDSEKALPLIYGSEDLSREMDKVSLRLEVARAEKAELELQENRGDVVPVSEVAKVVGNEYTNVRARILSIPSRCAKDLSLETNPALVKERLDQEVAEALAELTADSIYEEAEHVEQPNPVTETNETENSQGPA